jgi:amidohydrolase
MALHDRLRDDSLAMSDDLTALRHDLHRHPEVGLDLPRTQERVLAALEGLPLEISPGKSLTSVTAVLRGGRPGPAVLLRGDMDALPVEEQTGVEYSSQVQGAMHACGHDLHTAMLAGAARLLSANREELRGDVVFMFQPGEEGCDGAGRMLDEGVLDAAGPRASSAYGMHVMSARIRRHIFTARPETLMAASDWLEVTVHGAGGHGSMPHLSRDPIAVAAEIVTALQTAVTRNFDVFDPVVVTVGSFHGGTRRNIIPDDARFDATVRSFSAAARERIQTLAPEVCRGVAAAHGLDADVAYHDEYPLTVNDAEHTAFVAGVVADVFGDDRYEPMRNPSAGAEDFSRVLDAVPGCYLFLGAHPGDDPDATANNHSPRAEFVDDVMPDGVLLHAQLAVRALERDAAAQGPLAEGEGA